MKRKITGYHLDEHEDWVAELDCYHGQHVRHDPPFKNRPWVEKEEGRKAKLGEELNCVRCDRLELPEGLVSYRKTAIFTEHSIPKALLKDHSLADEHWGLLHVLSGGLLYTIKYSELKPLKLSKGEQAVIVPSMLHAVAPLGPVQFYVAFYSKSGLE